MAESICVIEGCDRPSSLRGWCGMHYARWRRHGDPGEAAPRYSKATASLAERFARIGCEVTEAGCWEWRGHRRPTGYGAIGVGKRKVGYTHRVAWELANGPIPDGLWVLHRCDNPPCCNPDHLFLGDNAANHRDMMEKGRHRPHGRDKTHCHRGHPLSGDNVHLCAGRRQCRACGRIKTQKYRARRLAAG